MAVTPAQIIELLHLSRHPTCGFVRETYRSSLKLPESLVDRPSQGGRFLGSVLYFLVTPDAQIRLHRIPSDQVYHHYLGDPLDVLLLYVDGSADVITVGADLQAGMRPQLFIPGGTFHTSRLPSKASFALLGTSEWVSVEPPDVELGDPKVLMKQYPGLAHVIEAFTEHHTAC
jgi:predicted cupin superfamily sugar epimerase